MEFKPHTAQASRINPMEAGLQWKPLLSGNMMDLTSLQASATILSKLCFSESVFVSAQRTIKSNLKVFLESEKQKYHVTVDIVDAGSQSHVNGRLQCKTSKRALL